MEPKKPEPAKGRGEELDRKANSPEIDARQVEDEALKRPIERRERESEQREHGELTEE